MTRTRATFLAALALPIALASALPAAAAPPQAESRWLDRRLDRDERANLERLLGYAPPALPADAAWIGAEPMTWDGMKGKVVIVQTWSRQDALGRRWPEQLGRIMKSLPAEDVVALAVHTTDGADGLVEYLARRESPVPVMVDASGAFTDAVGAGARPVNFLVDRAGAVRYVGLSPQGVSAAAEALVAEAVADAPVTPAPAVEAPPRTVAKPGRPAAFPDIDRRERMQHARDLRGKPGPQLDGVEWFEQTRPDLGGKVVLLEYFATWCGPCRAVKPKIKSLGEQFAEDVVVITVSNEDRETVRPLTEDDTFAGYVVLDDNGKVFQYANVQAIPHTIIMSSDGVVRWQGNPQALEADVLGQIVEANRTLNGG